MKLKILFFCLLFLLIGQVAAADVLPTPICRPGETPDSAKGVAFCITCPGDETSIVNPQTGEVTCPKNKLDKSLKNIDYVIPPNNDKQAVTVYVVAGGAILAGVLMVIFIRIKK